MASHSSRHKRFVDDVTSAIEFCKNNSIDFTDFLSGDECLNFTWRRKTTRKFTLCVSEDYPENSALTDLAAPHQPAFHRGPVLNILKLLQRELLAAENSSPTMEEEDPSAINSEEGNYSDEMTDDEDDAFLDVEYQDHLDFLTESRQLNQLLCEDIASYEKVFTPETISTRHLESIDEIDIDIPVPITTLQAEIASAWAMDSSEPLIVRLHMSSVGYLDSGLPPTVEVYQHSKRDKKVCVFQQLKKILERFIQDQWKKGISNQKVAECKAKATSSSTVKPEASSSSQEGAAEADSKPLTQMMEMGIDSGVAVQCLALANGDVSTAVNMAFSEAESRGDPPPIEEPEKRVRLIDGLYGKSRLRRGKGDRVSSEVASKQATEGFLHGADKKFLQVQEPPPLDHGFLVQLGRYVQKRLVTLNEFCVVCDNPHVFTRRGILKPAVCARELCVFAFQTLGVMMDATSEIAVGHEVISLLLALTKFAAQSQRREIILDPYPLVPDPGNPGEMALSPKKKDFDLIVKVLSHLHMKDMLTFREGDMKKYLDKEHPMAFPLLQWIIASNRSHIVRLPPAYQLPFMKTDHQFLLMSSPPAKEAKFRAAKEKLGSCFAFHGSSIENWHGIIRDGLVVASGTNKQMNGAAHGRGIYLSPRACFAQNYTNHPSIARNRSHKTKARNPDDKYCCLDNAQTLTCMALCEVIRCPNSLRKHDDIWVCNNSDYVCTRFFFVYENGQFPAVLNSDVNADHAKADLQKALQFKF